MPDVALGASEPAAHFTLALLRHESRNFPPAADLLRAFDLSHVKQLHLVLAASDAPWRWDEAARLIGDLEAYLRERRAPLEVEYELHTALTSLSKVSLDFVGQRLARVTLPVTDNGLSDDDFAESAERAAQLANWGIRIRPRLCLTRRNMPRWAERAEAWRCVCRGASVSFLRPWLGPSPWESIDDVPPGCKVAEFLASVYEGGRHDLTQSEPFAALLRAISAGTRAVTSCGSPDHGAVDSEGRCFACEHRAQPGARIPNRNCTCAFVPFCDALAAPCSALRAAAGTDRWREWEGMFCDAVTTLLPKMFEDLAVAARFQTFLTSRPSDERFRVCTQDGRLHIERQRLTTVPVASHHD